MNRKQIAIVTLLSLMLVFATSGLAIERTRAGNPHQGTLTIHLVLDSVDYEGYHAIAHSMVTEFAKIGITLELDYRDAGVIFDTIDCGGSHWNYTWDDAPYLGWDLTFEENWGMPTDLLWFPGMYAASGTCPYGWQEGGYNNTKADDLLIKSFQALEIEKRRDLILKYQEELVHDPAYIQLYAAVLMECTDSRLQTTWGEPAWDPAAWTFDPTIYTWVESPMPEKVVVKWGDDTDLWGLNPFFMWNYAQDVTQCFTHSMLYAVSKNASMMPPTGEGYITRPILAADHPVWSPDNLIADVYLRDDVYWHNFTDIYTDPDNPVPYNGEKFTADDVVCTFEALMDPASGAWGRGDYVDVLNTTVYPGGVEKVTDYHVRFHLLAPYAAFETLMANEWGAMIVPEHILGSVAHKNWYGHWTNKKCPPPGTGTHQWVERVSGERWKIEVNPDYPAALGGPHPFDEVIFYVIDSPAAGWIALMNHDIHFGDCWEATPAQLATAAANPEFNVYDAPLPCTRYVAVNLRHPILSNRYVRQAIAHAIDYTHIVDDILPAACVKGTIQAGCVWPMMEWAFHDTLPPIEYNITKAQMYMDMWKYSLPEYAPYGTPEDPDPTGLVAQGPLGDFDFSGYGGDVWDFTYWADNVGTATDALPWSPHHDIDPDANNDEDVGTPDFPAWADYPGYYYPERSKTWEWSR